MFETGFLRCRSEPRHTDHCEGIISPHVVLMFRSPPPLSFSTLVFVSGSTPWVHSAAKIRFCTLKTPVHELHAQMYNESVFKGLSYRCSLMPCFFVLSLPYRSSVMALVLWAKGQVCALAAVLALKQLQPTTTPSPWWA